MKAKMKRKIVLWTFPIPIVLSYLFGCVVDNTPLPKYYGKYDIRVHDTYLTYDDRAVTVKEIRCRNYPSNNCTIYYMYSDEDSDMLDEALFNAMVRERVNRIDKRKRT